MLRQFWYGHCAMPLYRVYAFLFPIYVPLNCSMDINPFTLPRRPFFVVWPVHAIRKYRIWSIRRALIHKRQML